MGNPVQGQDCSVLMQLKLCVAICCVLLMGCWSSSAPPPPLDPVVPQISPKVVQAWEEAGGDHRNMGHWATHSEYVIKEVGDDRNAIPAFQFDKVDQKVLAGLPRPAVPFGLQIGPDYWGPDSWGPESGDKRVELTAADIDALAQMENLSRLKLKGVKISGGVAAIAKLPQVDELSLDSYTLGDEGIAALTALKHVEHIDLTRIDLSKSDLSLLKELPKLRGLCLGVTKVDKTQLLQLSKAVPQLETLGLTGQEITDAEFEVIAKFKNLKRLSHMGDNVTSDGMLYLAELPLEDLEVIGADLHGSGAKAIGSLEELRELDLASETLQDADLKQFSGLRKLERLFIFNLGREKISDDGLSHLNAIPDLKRLKLMGASAVTGASLAKAEFKDQLQELALDDSQVNDAGLAGIAECQNLRRLTLSVDIPYDSDEVADITDPAVRMLIGKLKHLEELNLIAEQLTDAGLKGIDSLEQLETLWLTGSAITGTGLAGCKVHKLSLSSTKLDAAGLKTLAGLPNLEVLEISVTQIKDNDTAELANLTNLTQLSLMSCPITDAAIPNLSKLKHLEVLTVWDTQITEVGKEKLRQALPQCSIE